MNDIVAYLGTHHEIKELVLVLGVKSSAALVYDVCRIVQLDSLVLVALEEDIKKEVQKMFQKMQCGSGMHMPGRIEWTGAEGILAYQAQTNHLALMFDSLEQAEQVNVFSVIKPRYLIGMVNRQEIHPVKIWEAYRKVCEYIYILSWEEDHQNEAMNWTRNAKDGIELSLIFPVYCVADYIEKCITSVTAWKADYVEYLFVDDGSLDESADLIRSYAKKDKRIRLFQKTNGGCASARQYGLERARGRYVGFVDPDDYVDETMFRKLFSRALTGSYEISYCGYQELYEDTQTTKEVPDVLGMPYMEGTSDRNRIDELIAYRRVAIWRGIYLKDMILRNKIHFYTDIRRFDDLPFKMETLAVARSVVAVPEYLYYYRMLRPGQDVSADDERLYVHFLIFKYLDKFFSETKEKVQLDYLQVVKIQTHRWALEKIRPEFMGEYCLRARKDLLSNFPYQEGKYILRQFASWKDQLYFTAICSGNIQLVKLLAGYQGGRGRVRRKQRQLKKFEQISVKYGK